MALAPQDVGRRIAEARKAKGWTHQQLADAMNVDKRTAERWQKGWDPKRKKSTLPRLTGNKGLVRLAEVLDVELAQLTEPRSIANGQSAEGAILDAAEHLRFQADRMADSIDQFLAAVRDPQAHHPEPDEHAQEP